MLNFRDQVIHENKTSKAEVTKSKMTREKRKMTREKRKERKSKEEGKLTNHVLY